MNRLVVNPEYLRRNTLVARAAGAEANARLALKRLQQQGRSPKWLVETLRGIVQRVSGLDSELASYRAAVPREIRGHRRSRVRI